MRLPKMYDDAATICALAASNRGDRFLAACADSIGAPYEAETIASTCFACVPIVRDRADRERLEWAEAEAWIRSGWREPGDERDFS